MTEPPPAGADPASQGPVVPPLPGVLADPRPVVVVGTLAWLVATLVALVHDVGHGGLGEISATCLVGLALGAVGYTIFYLQRRTVRRGGRGQQGIG